MARQRTKRDDLEEGANPRLCILIVLLYFFFEPAVRVAADSVLDQ